MAEANKINKHFLILFTIYCALSAIIVSSVYFFSKRNLEREFTKLQSEISTISEVKSGVFRSWIKGKRLAVESVSENLSVKMFLSEDPENADLDEKLSQEQFINNYLKSEAEKNGFTNLSSENAIKANVKTKSRASLAIFNKDMMPVLSVGLQENLLSIFSEADFPIDVKKEFADIRFSEDNHEAYLLVIKAVQHIQSEDISGYVIGIKKLDGEFINVANSVPDITTYSSIDLAVKRDDGLVMLSNKIGKTFEKLSYLSDRKNLAETDSIFKSGTIVERYNRKNVNVFAVAKDIMDGKIFLIYNINEREALATARKYQKNINSITVLGVVIVGLLLLLVWRHSTSLKYQRISRELDRQTALLKMVTDNQLQSMFLLSDKNEIIFVNKTFLAKHRLEAEEAVNKPVSNVLGADLAKEYIALSDLSDEAPIIVTKKTDQRHDGGFNYVQRKSVPIQSQSGFLYHLIAENDITSLMKERIKFENNLNNVIETLIRIIEQRSAYFHNHSKRISEISSAVAESLKVEDKIKKAVEISAKLCNLYLALMPREIINKQDGLTEDEKKMFETFPRKTIELIRDLEFDAPVIETLSQMMEKPDGTGPEKLMEDDIIESAKILKVVNDFVAMTSERPYREKLTTPQALDILLRQKDKKYSSKIIYALANCVSV